MKNAIAGTWVYMIVIIFMVILIAYVAITINYANTFEISEQMIKAIEQSEGLNQRSLEIMDGLIKDGNHTVTHGCGTDKKSDTFFYGVKDKVVSKTPNRNDYNYCIAREEMTIQGSKKYYYKVQIFFSFSLPVLGDLYAFTVQGETSGLSFVKDDYF
jgi:hypothetical protein